MEFIKDYIFNKIRDSEYKKDGKAIDAYLGVYTLVCFAKYWPKSSKRTKRDIRIKLLGVVYCFA
jgi:hypothetical protein